MTDRDEQIEEMARVWCPFPERDTCDGCDKGCFEISKSEMLHDAGYRKASDVAREIFEEIEKETKNHGICYTQRKIAELKKKLGDRL